MHDICVVGLGAIGVIYALALERSDRARVTAVCRSNYQTLRDYGLEIDSSSLGKEKAWKPYRVVQTAAEAADRKYTFVVCCFKALPDVQTSPQLVAPLLQCTNTFVLIQNGLGIERDFQTAVPDATVISGCAWIDCTTIDSGRKVLHDSFEKLTLGVHEKTSSRAGSDGDSPHSHNAPAKGKDELNLLVDLLRSGGMNPDSTGNIDAERWRKVFWNASYSTLCTITRASVPEILSGTVLKQTMPVIQGLMTEVLSVARADGIGEDLLPESAIAETMEGTISEYMEDPEGKRVIQPFKPSMLVDLEHGRPMEVEVIVGSIVRKAKELGVPIPQLDIVYASLKVIQAGLLRHSR